MLKEVETIILDGKETKVYLCDRNDRCKNSKYCGNLCTKTFNEKHAVIYEQVSLFAEDV